MKSQTSGGCRQTNHSFNSMSKGQNGVPKGECLGRHVGFTNQSILVLSSQCIHSSEGQHEEELELQQWQGSQILVRNSSFGLSCFLICKMIVLNQSCTGALRHWCMTAYWVHLFPAHIQQPHFSGLKLGMGEYLHHRNRPALQTRAFFLRWRDSY